MKNRTCALCGRELPEGEHAAVGEQWLCHPDDPTLQDCYSLVTVHGWKLRPTPKGRYVGAHRA